jgi:C4-dicarboxylate-specific signal transduction histidine kinase
MVEDIGERVRANRALLAKQAELECALKELESAYDKALQIEKLSALGTFVGGLAHEIKNPLMGLDNYIEYVQLQLDDREQQALLGKARNQVARIGRIVDGVLTYARGGLQRPEPVPLAALIDDVTSLLGSEIIKHGITLTMTGAADLPPLTTDRSVLEQALLNLLLNAIHAVRDRDDRRIEVALSDDGEQVRIAVGDSGPGVPVELHRRIYDPFFTTKPPGEGTGLGLSVALRNLSEIGATLHIDEGFRQGARFVITVNRQPPSTTTADEREDRAR